MFKSLSMRRGLALAIVAGLLGFSPITSWAAPAVEEQSPIGWADDAPVVQAADVISSTVNATYRVRLPLVRATFAEPSWPMSGANPQRTSWTPTEVRGTLRPVWYRPIEPYISQKVQIIAAYDMIFVATARGLYALDAATGATKWVYGTEVPLGNSPTIDNGVAYVGGLDHKLYALNAYTGQFLWAFEATQGFDTNPLVVDGKVLLGNRDGYFYAIYAHEDERRGQLAWKYKTAGSINFSAAYLDGAVYFASNDSYAYALNAADGALVWKSAKLPGSGFHSWWPVVYQNQVVFAGSNNYRSLIDPFWGPIQSLDRDEVFPNHISAPRGTLVGTRGTTTGGWTANTVTVDASKITTYFENKPWRRTLFVLDRATGAEYTFDANGNGKAEYAPFLWLGTKGEGNRYPPVVGKDGVLYSSSIYMSAPYIVAGHISGWKNGTATISLPSSRWTAADEPIAYAAGGNVIYWNHTLSRSAGGFDIARANPNFPNLDSSREWVYWDYNLQNLIPGFPGEYWRYGGSDGAYSAHGDQNAPIPYKNRVYVHRDNGIIALGATTAAPTVLAPAATVAAPAATVTTPTTAELKARLAAEIQKMLDAGHLRSGYMSSGLFDLMGNTDAGDKLMDYFHNPGDTIVTLINALPHLEPAMQTQVRQYIQTEYNAYTPCNVGTVGHASGAAREAFDLPPEVAAIRSNYGSSFAGSSTYGGWKYWANNKSYCAPHSFYALWKYAQTFGNARTIFDRFKNYLQAPPADATLQILPEAHNAYIAGYWGYLELQALAGYTETASVRATLDHLLALRASTLSPTNTARNYYVDGYGVVLSAARNFMYLVPELGDYLHDNALTKVQDTVTYFNTITPLWFVAKAEEHGREGVIQPLYDTFALFQAKALVLQQSRAELMKYLDVPGFARGDLFHLQNLIAVIEAQ